MKTIPLTQGKEVIVDDDYYELFSPFKWCLQSKKYAARRCRCSDGKDRIVLMHRLIANADMKQVTHHKNGDTLDNRASNLEVIENQSIHMTRHEQIHGPKRGKFRGTFKNKGYNGWKASITIDRKTCYLGSYTTSEEAARAWDKAARENFGPDCFQNFPTSDD